VTDLPPPPPPPSSPPPPGPPPAGPPPAGSPSPDAGTALSYGWQKFQQNAGPMIVIVLIQLVAEAVISGIALTTRSLVVRLLVGIIVIVVGSIVSLGLFQMGLMATAGERVDIGKAYTYDRWGEWIGFSVVFGLMVIVGLYLCIIPGLLVLAFFGLAPYFFIERRMSLGESLTASRMAVQMKGLAFPVLLSIVVGGIGYVVCFLVALVTAPIAYVAVAFLYRYAVGHSVAA
jgi:hypothetical protein